MKKKIFILIYLIILPLSTFAGGGHDHSHGGHSHGDFGSSELLNEVLLTKQSITNLGIKSEIAKIGIINKVKKLFAQTVVHPSSHYHLPAQFKGKISKLFKLTGEYVEKGEPLGAALPLVVGNREVLFTSPINGLITAAPDSIGDVFSESDIVFDVSDMTNMIVRADLYQGDDSKLVKVGQEAIARFSEFPRTEFKGKIERIDASLREDLPLLHVYMTVENKDLKLRPNLRGSLSVFVGKGKEALIVPESSLLGELGQSFVYVRKYNVFQRRDVVLGERGGAYTEIKSGVKAGERVVVVGQYQLQFAKSNTDKRFGPTDSHGHSHAHGNSNEHSKAHDHGDHDHGQSH
ncbi:MAG: efflux RND transporter periplasmic adaptor subunit [Bdellovibrionales bacterium]|nr:efflux RND transporter periplasmic adaptor subunit [Bdellovibrionales bacterium]